MLDTLWRLTYDLICAGIFGYAAGKQCFCLLSGHYDHVNFEVTMQEFSLMDYAPIGIMFLVAVGFAISQLLAAQLIGPRKRTATKLMPYECGKDPVGSARDRFSIKFYIVAVTFLLFDLEILFMVPFAVAFKQLLGFEQQTGIPYGTIAFVGIMAFLVTVVVGLIYDWKKGAFDWSLQARASAKAQAIALRTKQRHEHHDHGDIRQAA